MSENANVITKGSARQLRHEIIELIEGTDYDLEYQVRDLLAGQPGLSFETQRERATQVVTLLNGADGANVNEAITLAQQLVALIDAREAEANNPVAKTAAAIAQAKAALDALTAARVEAQEQETKLMNLLDQLAEIEAELVVPEAGDATA